MSVTSTQSNLILEILQPELKENPESLRLLYTTLVRYLRGLMKEGNYSSYSTKSKREEAISAFRELHNALNGTFVRNEEFFAEQILPLWLAMDEGTKKEDTRTPWQRVLDGESPT
jgi:hypothetical protein